MPRDGTKNLIPVTARSKDEAKELGRKGGIKSGEVRAAKKSIRELVKIALETPMPDNAKAELIKKNPALADTDINLRLAMVLGQADSAKKGNTSAFKELLALEDESTTEYREYKIPAEKIASSFVDVNRYITDQDYQEYVFKGGRGSTKSSYVSMKILELIKNNDTTHAVVVRKVADTLRQSVYAQMVWAISELGLDDEFKCTVSPMEITRKSTGQKIYFRGADDEAKLKSIKVSFGYIGILWYEELDSFNGDEQIRSITQSVIRGGNIAYIFKSFNPPITTANWANKYILLSKDNRYVHHSTYLTVPQKWLGKPFIDEAEWLKEIKERAYEHEYMGVPTGTGSNVFENVTIREIPDSELETFDRLYYGLDFGYIDPFAFAEMYFNANQRKLYIYGEKWGYKTTNEQLAVILNDYRGVKIVCDSAEPKSIQDLNAWGFTAFGAKKGPGSLLYSFKWLQSLSEVIIDNRRCPHIADEFLTYEYEKTKDGEIITSFPDKNDHGISAVRYGLEEIWARRGM